MKITFRQFDASDRDYSEAVRIWNAAWPDRKTSVELLRFEDGMRKAEYFFQRTMAETEQGEIAGFGTYAETWWNQTADQYSFNFTTHPDHRRQGVAGAFYQHARSALAEKEPASLVAFSREDQTDAIRFLTNRGFRIAMRLPVSALDMTRFDRASFGDPDEMMRRHGIVLHTLPEVQALHEDWQRRLHDLNWAIVQDMPHTEPPERMPFDVYCKIFDAPDLPPQGWIVAVESETAAYVGLSNVWLSDAQPDIFDTGLTGVVRSHRRMSIATAMKLRIIDYARAIGITEIRTDNEENNPMLGINLRLGFETRPALLDFRLDLTSSGDE